MHVHVIPIQIKKKNKEKISQINYTVLRNNEFSTKNLVQTHLLDIDLKFKSV